MKDRSVAAIRRPRPPAQIQASAPEAANADSSVAPVAAHFGHTLSAIALHSAPALAPQPKLTVNAPGDIYEQEADQVASDVLRMSEDEVQTMRADAGVQRVCAECAEEQQASTGGGSPEEELMQAKEAPGATPEVTAETQSAIDGMHGGGAPLDAATRSFMEPRFGHDFSQVRVHTDQRAATAARAINALAFTTGSDIAFAPGQYQPGSDDGRQLLAHELTHTIQQTGGVQRVQREEGDGAAPSAPAGQSTIEEMTNGAISANGPMVTINGVLSVSGPLARIEGVTQTDTLVANSVVASSYTPGAGNVW